jgi:hypothetical protein
MSSERAAPGDPKLDILLSKLTPEMERRIRRLIRFAERNAIPIEFIDQGFRTCQQQNALYHEGTSPARGCRSWHTWGRAVDLYVSGWQRCGKGSVCEGLYEILADYWKSMGGKWGGDFSYRDMVHFEWHPGMDSVSELCPHADFICPQPPWPDDRPWYIRGQLPLGVGMAALGIGGAFFVWKSI